jgi:hypothetical protein
MTVGITELPPEGMQLGGVALAGDADRGTKTTEGLSLLFTTAGITVQGPQPQIERLLVWSGLDTATCREKIALTDGRSAAVMELTSGGQSIRFLLPTETVTPGQAAYLDQALPAWLARYKGSSGPSATPPPAPPASQTTSTGGAPGAPAAAAAAGAAAGAVGAAANGSGTGPGGVTPPAPHATTPPPPPPTGHAAGSATGPDAGSTSSPAPSFASTPAEAPPPPPPGGMAATQSAGPPPPPTVAPPGSGLGAPAAAAAAAGVAAGWEGLADPAAHGAEAAAWQGPPLGQVPAGDVLPPQKKTRSWRRGRQDAEAPPPPGASGQLQPPSGPPPNPVILTPGTLPPPAGYPSPSGLQDPLVWKPPIDPVTGEAVWDTTTPAADFAAPTETAPKRSRGWKRGAKAGAAAGVAAGAAGATALDGGLGFAAPTTAPGAPGVAGAPGDTGAGTSGPGDPFATAGQPPAPGDGTVPPASGGHSAKGGRNNRTAILLLVLLLVVVAAGGAYYFVKNRNNNTTTTTVAPAVPSGGAAAYALAQSINLRLTDLPTGWTHDTAPGAAARPPAPSAAALASANQALATCLDQPTAVVSGLFGLSAPGQLALATSPVFQSASVPGIQMYSATRTMSTATEAQALAAPFVAPNFATCYGTYQTTLASAAVPGATAAVQVVTLTAPSTVHSFGYVTTFTLPGQGTEVVGQAFIIGGRTETRLQPSTTGAAIPSSDFNPPYNAIVGRVAQAAAR